MARGGYVDGIKRLRSGKYQVRVKSIGRIHVQSFDTEQGAKVYRDYLRRQNAAARVGMPLPPPPPAPSLTLAQAFARRAIAMKADRRQPKSIQQLEYVADLFSRALGSGQAAALSYEDLDRFVAWARRNLTSQRGRAIQLAISMARTAIGRAGLPVPKAPPVTVLQRAQKTVPRGVAEKLLAELQPGSLERTFAEVIFRTARRETEVRRLTIGDVDLKRGILMFQRLKGKRPGDDPHPIGPILRRIIEVYLVGHCQGLPPDAPLFGLDSIRDGVHGRHALEVTSLAKRLQPAAARAGVGKRVRTLGWLRNQAATDARRAGDALDDISLYLGHADVSTTARHYQEDDRWASRKRIAGRIDRRLPAAGYTLSASGPAGKAFSPNDAGRGKRERKLPSESGRKARKR